MHKAFLTLFLTLAASLFLNAGMKNFLPYSLSDEWTLFCPAELQNGAIEKLSAVPEKFCGVEGKKVKLENGFVDIPVSASKNGPAILMQQFDSAFDGVMQVGAGADWYWCVYANGKKIYDRMQGNAVGPISSRNHNFYFDVRKGSNLIAVEVLRGSNGWRFACGSVPFIMDRKGILSEKGFASTSFIITYPDGRVATQEKDLTNIRSSGKGKMVIVNADADEIKFSQYNDETKNRRGDYGIKTRYAVSSDERFTFESAKGVISFPASGFAGKGSITSGDSEFAFPEKPGAAVLNPDFKRPLKSLTVANDYEQLVITGDDLVMEVIDTRVNGGSTFDLRFTVPKTENQSTAYLDLVMYPGTPAYKITAGKEWVELPFTRDVEKGSILDFSFIADSQAPAGKYGRILTGSDGNLIHSQTGGKVRLIGANLCFSANYLSKDECDRLAEVFRKQGYNAVRFHHTDVDLIKGGWNAQNSYDINEGNLDKFDYLFAAMKKAGLYVTVDFYTMRFFGAHEIKEINKRIMCDVKALLPVSDSAFEAWTKLVLEWMNHVNPYTGIAWKDDPALLWACPLNEDTIYSVLPDSGIIFDIYKAKYQDWKKAGKITAKDKSPLKTDPNFTRFLVETKMASNRKIAYFLKDNGIKLPLSGSNWWNTEAQTYTREQFDIVDNHQYSDHPFNNTYNQTSCLRAKSPGRFVPTFMTPTRIFGKPFAVTEYNFCFPNQFRAEAGPLFGGYCSLQGWDAIFRFAWAHDKKEVLDQAPISGFNIASDALSLLADKQISLLFVRGDAKKADKKYLYAVTAEEAYREGCGGMWAKGQFPEQFAALAAVSQIGSQVVEGKAEVAGKYDGVSSMKKPSDALLSGNRFIPISELGRIVAQWKTGDIVSDNGEITLNNYLGYVKVVTPKTECFAAMKDIPLDGKNLSISGNSTFASVSASAMDGRDLSASEKVLIMHLTNVLNSGIKFSTPEMRRVESWGKTPLLVKTGSVQVKLANTNDDMVLYALDTAGRRLRKVPAGYNDGAYTFKLEIKPGEAPALAYEFVRERKKFLWLF